jgi:hypothetical protein
MADAVIYRRDTLPESGLPPWHRDERDNWYAISADRENGTTAIWAKRTGHAAAVGRALLERSLAEDTGYTAVRVYHRDTDQDTWPAVTPDGQEIVEVENQQALAVVTDPRPVSEAVEELERALEEARIARRAYDAARDRVLAGARTVYAESDELDPGDPSHRSGNAIAAMLRGIVSRPTVLKFLFVQKGAEDL